MNYSHFYMLNGKLITSIQIRLLLIHKFFEFHIVFLFSGKSCEARGDGYLKSGK